MRHRLGGWPVGNRGRGATPQTHTSIHPKYHLYTHTKAPTVCNTEAIINTCNNIFTARFRSQPLHSCAHTGTHVNTRARFLHARHSPRTQKGVYLYVFSEFCARKQVETEQEKSGGLQKARKHLPHLAPSHR